MKKLILLLIIFFSLPLMSQESLVFGIIQSDTPLSSINNQNRLIRYIEQSTGFSVKRLHLKTDEEMLTAFRSGIVDFAWIGTFTYMKYRTQINVVPIVKPMRYNRTFYRAAVITHKGSEVQSLEMLTGKTIAFVSRNSEAGYIYPRVMLYEKKMIEGKDYFTQFLKGHDNVIYEVHSGKYDGGCVFDSALDVFLNSKQRSEIRVVEYSRDIPYEPIVMSIRSRKDRVEFLQDKLINCNDRTLLDSLDIQSFQYATDQEYKVYNSNLFFEVEE
jgi:phosphate/phosphite/phosphonate ABC transporter binding protein